MDGSERHDQAIPGDGVDPGPDKMVMNTRGEVRNEQKFNQFNSICSCTRWRNNRYQTVVYTIRRIFSFCE